MFLLARKHDQVSLSKSWYDLLSDQAPCHGKIVIFFAYARANKTCQGKLARLYGALDRLDLISFNMYKHSMRIDLLFQQSRLQSIIVI